MDRYKVAKKASILGMIGNIFLLIIKLIIGIITNSQSMIGDAVNSAGDIYSSLMTFIGVKIARKMPDEDHIYGHGKAEYIFTMLISVSIIMVSSLLLFNSTKSIFKHSEYIFSKYLIVVCIITIIVKASLYIYTHRIAKKYNNILIEANARDHISDCVLTTTNLIACITAYFGILIVDSIVGILVSIWIMKQGFELFSQSFDVLMDKGMDEEEVKKIIHVIDSFKEIKKYNHLNTTPIGYNYQVSVTIFVDGNLSTYESHEIANKLEKELMKLDEVYLAIIHVNPI